MRDCASAADEFLIENVQVGIEGLFKVGVWSPIAFEIAGPTGAEVRPVVVTADPDGQATSQPLSPVTLADGTAEVRGLFRSGRLGADVLIELHHEGRSVAARPVRVEETGNIRCLPPATRLWAVAGTQPPMSALSDRWNEFLPNGFETVSFDAVLSARNAEDLEILDGIFLTAGTDISHEIADLLRAYVERGGKLVVVVGSAAEPLRSGPLAEWLPVLPKSQSEVRNLSGINELIPGSATLRMIGSLPAGELDAAQGVTIANGLTFPLILRSAYGIGTVTLVAVPLDQRPLSTWDSIPSSELAARMTDESPPWRSSASGTVRREDSELSPTGVGDLQTQLLHSVDHFSNVRRSSHQSLLAWMMLLVLILGPLDYVVVHRVLRRPELTWVTALVAMAAVAAVAIRRADSANSVPLSTAQVDLVDLDAAQGTVRNRSFMSLYSPTATRRTVLFGRTDAAPGHRNAPPSLFRAGWAGRPEEGYRGMNRLGELDSTEPGYRLPVDRNGMLNLPMLVWGTSTFECDWEQSLPVDEIALSDLEDGGGNRLTGTFELKLPIELTDWFIAYGDFSYTPRLRGTSEVPPLAPGTVWNMRDFGSNLLRGQLIGLTTSSAMAETGIKATITVERTNYDPLSRDAAVICKILSFHEAAGGTAYTGLTNAPLSRCDLSPLVKLNRAVVYGRMSRPMAAMTVDGNAPGIERQDTFVRLILPVRIRVRSRDSSPSPDLLERRK